MEEELVMGMYVGSNLTLVSVAVFLFSTERGKKRGLIVISLKFGFIWRGRSLVTNR